LITTKNEVKETIHAQSVGRWQYRNTAIIDAVFQKWPRALINEH